MISGQSASVPMKPFGPCCSIEPIGMTIVRDFVSHCSMSCQVDTGSSMGSVLSGAEAAGDVAHLASGTGLALAIEGQRLVRGEA